MPVIADSFERFGGDGGFYVVLNTEGLYFLLFDLDFAKCVRSSDAIFIDGVGLKKALRLSGFGNVNRLHGPDLFHQMLHRCNGRKKAILGGSDRAHRKLISKYPELGVNNEIWLWSGVVDVNNLDGLIHSIESFGADEVYVCLGIRKQELVSAVLSKRLPGVSVVGVGAAIDFESDNVIRSSIKAQQLGLEWFTRTFREPRMIPRHMRALLGMLIFSLSGIIFGSMLFKRFGIESHD